MRINLTNVIYYLRDALKFLSSDVEIPANVVDKTAGRLILAC